MQLSGKASHSHVKLSGGFLKVSLNLVHPTRHTCVILRNANSLVGSVPRLSASAMITYLSVLLQYQIMYNASTQLHLKTTCFHHNGTETAAEQAVD